jgi:Ca2+-binding RTX toxin-like protein
MRDPRRVCTMLGLLAAIAMFATAMASSAQASTIIFDFDTQTISYAAPGATANNVVVNDAGADIVITDTGETITSAGPCSLDGTGHTATCSKSGVLGVSVATGDGDDRIVGGSASDLTESSIDAGAGNDIVDTGGGFDSFVEAGIGVDTITFASRPASIDVEAELRFGVTSDGQRHRGHVTETQNGTVVGRVLNLSAFENIVGGKGDDVLIGDEQGNILIGGPGPDTGADIMCGSLGNDTVDYSGNALSLYGVVVPGSPEGVHVTLDGTMPTDPRLATVFPSARQDCRSIDEASSQGDSLDPRTNPVDCTPDDGTPGEGDCLGDDVENVIGSDHNDVLIGNDPDPLYGGGPRVEPSGINHLLGGAGDDVLDGRGGPDVLDGGSGNDTVSYASRTEPIKASLDGSANDGGVGDLNSAYPDAAQADSIGTDVENVTGGSGNDVLRGDDGANVLNGGEGDDTLSGNGGHDTLAGGGGADNLSGGDGNDALGGGPGDDTLDGGFGGDAV